MSIIKEHIISQGHGVLSPSYFCVHSTANIGATAANHVNYWGNNPDIPMAHLVSDWNEAYHTVPYNALVYHVGNGNAYCEGLEICEADNYDDFVKGINIAAQVVRERLDAHRWTTDRLISHNDARVRWGGTDHTDPIPYFTRWGYSWEQFINLVNGTGDTEMISDDDIMKFWTHVLPNGRHARDIISDATSDVIRMHDNGIVGGMWGHKLPNGRVARDIVSDATSDIIRMHDTMLPKIVAQNEALMAAVQALSKSMGADPDKITNAVETAVKEKLESLKITVG